jgi:hypothetical protein
MILPQLWVDVAKPLASRTGRIDPLIIRILANTGQ